MHALWRTRFLGLPHLSNPHFPLTGTTSFPTAPVSLRTGLSTPTLPALPQHRHPPTLRLRRITLTLRQEIEKIYFVPGKRIYLRIQLHSGMETWMLFHVKSCTFLMWYGELFPPPYTLHAVVGKNVPCCAQVARISAESWNCSPDITVWIQTPLECAAVTTMVSGALT